MRVHLLLMRQSQETRKIYLRSPAALFALVLALPVGALTAASSQHRFLLDGSSIVFAAALPIAVFCVGFRSFSLLQRNCPSASRRPNVLLLSGCLLMTAIVVPTWLDWTTLTTASNNFESYRLEIFSHAIFSFPIHSLIGVAVLYSPLVGVILVLAGVLRGISPFFRARSLEARSRRGLAPLLFLAVICIVGLALIVDYLWLSGKAYWYLASLEKLLVVAALLWFVWGDFYRAFILVAFDRPAVSTRKEVSESLSRRRVTQMIVLLVSALGALELLAAWKIFRRPRLGESKRKPIANIDGLPVGSATIFSYLSPPRNCLLLRTGERTFVAYNQSCTHLSCSVIPEIGQGRLACPCHKGYFDLMTGHPIAGPPRQPLQRITLEVEGQLIYATSAE